MFCVGKKIDVYMEKFWIFIIIYVVRVRMYMKWGYKYMFVF